MERPVVFIHLSEQFLLLFSVKILNVKPLHFLFAVTLPCTLSFTSDMQFHIIVSVIIMTIWLTEVMDTLDCKQIERQVAEKGQRVVSAEPQLIGRHF